jgi:hypothetical protein
MIPIIKNMGLVLLDPRETEKCSTFAHDNAWDFPTLWLSVEAYSYGVLASLDASLFKKHYLLLLKTGFRLVI